MKSSFLLTEKFAGVLLNDEVVRHVAHAESSAKANVEKLLC
jgi:hypothetical protein